MTYHVRHAAPTQHRKEGKHRFGIGGRKKIHGERLHVEGWKGNSSVNETRRVEFKVEAALYPGLNRTVGVG